MFAGMPGFKENNLSARAEAAYFMVRLIALALAPAPAPIERVSRTALRCP